MNHIYNYRIPHPASHSLTSQSSQSWSPFRLVELQWLLHLVQDSFLGFRWITSPISCEVGDNKKSLVGSHCFYYYKTIIHHVSYNLPTSSWIYLGVRRYPAVSDDVCLKVPPFSKRKGIPSTKVKIDAENPPLYRSCFWRILRTDCSAATHGNAVRPQPCFWRIKHGFPYRCGVTGDKPQWRCKDSKSST